MTFNKATAVEALFHEFPSEAEHWFSLLKPTSIGAVSSNQTYEAWKDIPSTYVVCECDRIILSSSQKAMVASAKEVHPMAFDTVESLECGHEPIISNIGDLVRILGKAVCE